MDECSKPSKAEPSTDQLERWGIQLHDLMTAAMIDAGIQFLPHDDDPEHNMAAGRAKWMFLNGEPGDAEAWYNEWAANNGYPGILITSHEPLEVDIGTLIPGGMIADFHGGEVRILSVGGRYRRGV